MSSSCAKQLFCIFHVGGKYVNNLDGKMIYEGGIVIGRMISKGISYEDLKSLIATDVWPGNGGFNMKYTISLAGDTLLDLVDDVGVAQLIDYNNTNGHVFVCENVKELKQASQVDNIEVIHDLAVPSFGRSVSPSIWELEADNLSTPSPIQCVPPPISIQSGQRALNADGLIVESLPSTIPVMTSLKWKDELMSVGQRFAHAAAFKSALYKYSIAHNFAYDYVKNEKDKIIVKCKVDTCPWKVSAYGVDKKNTFLVIRRFMNEHMHFAQDNLVVPHKKRCTLTSVVILDELQGRIDKSPNAIRTDLQREYGLSLDYQQAYRAKEKALVQLHGRPKDSYMLIPWICDRLKESDKDTVAKYVASANNEFQALFIAYGCCMKGFLEGARPIIFVDGTHLSCPYRGTLLGAQAYDADDQLFPLAYAIVSGEYFEDWSWFLANIKEITGSLELTIVSDRHSAIRSAVQAIFGSERHAFCYRHVKENYSKEFLRVTRGQRKTSGQKKETALQMLDSIAYARLEADFNESMATLMDFCPEMVQWLETHGEMDRWAMSKFPYKRWDKITTNLAESFNAWLVCERKHNIAVLIHEHREKLAKKMYNSKMSMKNWRNGVGPNVEAKLMENVRRSEKIDAEDYGLAGFRIRPRGGGDIRVNLTLRECSCKAWQMSGLPCLHACAAIREIHGNVYAYVEDCFLLASQQKMYNKSMIPVETYDIPKPDSLKYDDYSSSVLLKPPLTCRPPGRPRVKRIESQFQNKKVYHCSRCGEAGHSVKTCRNPNPS